MMKKKDDLIAEELENGFFWKSCRFWAGYRTKRALLQVQVVQ